jgi:SAM-dependent methyltransferase
MSATGQAATGGLFEGTAEYYGRYRVPYPTMFTDIIGATCRLKRKDRLLDLGCGPGLLALQFSRWVGEVVGLDPEPEMLAAAAAAAKAADLRNLTWVRGSSQELGAHLGRFRLVTIGRAFHWMDRAKTLTALHGLVVPGGAVAVIGEEHEKAPGSWRTIVRELSQSRGDARNKHEDDPSHDRVIADSPFRGPELLYWPASITLTVEDILGHLRSTSMGALRTRAGTTAAFESEARQALMRSEPSGRFTEHFRFRAMIGWRD